jgi:hypothetical protein
MAEAPQILLAQTALAQALAPRPTFDGLPVNVDAALPEERVERFLNVVRSPEKAQILDEVLGLGEDDVVVEYAQIYHVEWIVQREDDARRAETFNAGLLDIQSGLYADRTLGGAARGLTIGVPNYENHIYAGAPHTSAVVIPVRVLLAGASPIG